MIYRLPFAMISVLLYNDFSLQVCQELAKVEQRWLLVEAVVQETKSLQELAGYPFQYHFLSTHIKVLYTNACFCFKRLLQVVQELITSSLMTDIVFAWWENKQ